LKIILLKKPLRTALCNKALLTVKPAATVEDAHMFLFVVDGAMVQLLSSNQTDEREYLIDYFLSRV
ncbi:hypothetical protein PWJ65_15235, partial [Acinetobacter nosocomialis]|nr:hypothetical protein [Acinetobacter nosocomialis]